MSSSLPIKKIDIGGNVSEITFECTDPNLKSFKDLLGKNIVLYFYPKDNTPGCTLEGKDFKTHYDKFLKLNTQVLGVSRDSLASHQKFCSKLALPFPLISDPEEKLCKLFHVIIEKNMFSRIVFGIERSTFLIDKTGIVQHIWRKVKVTGHVDNVLEMLQQM